jgi:hypothetical protein
MVACIDEQKTQYHSLDGRGDYAPVCMYRCKSPVQISRVQIRPVCSESRLLLPANWPLTYCARYVVCSKLLTRVPIWWFASQLLLDISTISVTYFVRFVTCSNLPYTAYCQSKGKRSNCQSFIVQLDPYAFQPTIYLVFTSTICC